MRTMLFTVAVAVALGASAQGQAPDRSPASLEVVPPALTLEVGQRATVAATVRDAAGEPIAAPVVFFSRARRSVGVTPAGVVEAHRPGEYTLVALVPRDPEEDPRRAEAIVRVEIPVTIPLPPVKTVAYVEAPERVFVGTTVPLRTRVLDTTDVVREDVAPEYASSDTSIVEVDRFGQLTVRAAGSTTVTVTAGAARADLRLTAVESPVTRLDLTASTETPRTGDVVRFTAVAADAEGQPVADMPVQFAVFGETAPGIVASGATALIDGDGRFVAEKPGRYTVVATAGRHVARRTLEIAPRDVRREIQVVGHGPVRDRHTSDLWVWEGADGRDYAITGTWGADGHAYIWDVTDPARLSIVDVVRVDARTVNDVKVSADGRIAVISREGASNRKNGLVILDVSKPGEGVSILSRFDDQLSGGVHNVFIHEGHVFALSAGRRYDIINIEDPTQPERVGRFELETPGHGIHDVWVEKGIAYSSNWTDGVVAVDVGGGGRGGSVRQPVLLGRYAYPNGWNHAAFPYRSKSTGKFYVFAGDEAFPYGDNDDARQPTRAAGWIHVIEWDDWQAPREVARYEVPEAGTHNLWIEDDIMYVAYYNGGLRVVDVSGELMGDLYKQGREIAFWEATDPDGFIPNAPMAWGPQPFKGHVFIADHNSGLWAVKLLDKKDSPTRNLGEPR